MAVVNKRRRFNTQPPEGGWFHQDHPHYKANSFNTQPPEGGWGSFTLREWARICFNTQPPEGGWVGGGQRVFLMFVSTHSRLKAAGAFWGLLVSLKRCFNTQPPEGGWV